MYATSVVQRRWIRPKRRYTTNRRRKQRKTTESRRIAQVCPWRHKTRGIENLYVCDDSKLQYAKAIQTPRALLPTASPATSLLTVHNTLRRRKTTLTRMWRAWETRIQNRLQQNEPNHSDPWPRRKVTISQQARLLPNRTKRWCHCVCATC